MIRHSPGLTVLEAPWIKARGFFPSVQSPNIAKAPPLRATSAYWPYPITSLGLARIPECSELLSPTARRPCQRKLATLRRARSDSEL